MQVLQSRNLRDLVGAGVVELLRAGVGAGVVELPRLGVGAGVGIEGCAVLGGTCVGTGATVGKSVRLFQEKKERTRVSTTSNGLLEQQHSIDNFDNCHFCPLCTST
jgi:hypothetical protein